MWLYVLQYDCRTVTAVLSLTLSLSSWQTVNIFPSVLPAIDTAAIAPAAVEFGVEAKCTRWWVLLSLFQITKPFIVIILIHPLDLPSLIHPFLTFHPSTIPRSFPSLSSARYTCTHAELFQLFFSRDTSLAARSSHLCWHQLDG